MTATRVANYNSVQGSSCAYTSDNTAGNSLICVVYAHGPSVLTGFTVTDTAGNIWSLCGSFYSAYDGGEGWHDNFGVYLISGCQVGPNTVSAAPVGGSVSATYMCVIEYADVAGLAFDTTSYAVDYSGGGSDAVNSGNITTSVTSDVVIGFATTGGYDFTSPSSPWTRLAYVTTPTTQWMTVCDNLNVASGTTSFAGTGSGNPDWLAAIYAFKAGSAPPPPAYAFVQEVNSLTFAPPSASSFTLPSITPSAGNLLVAWVESSSSTPSVSSDTGGNSWAQVGTTQARAGGSYYIAMFRAIATGNASVLTFAIPGGGSPSGQIMEFSGNVSRSPTDTSSQSSGVSTSPTCGITTNNTHELVVAAACPDTGGAYGPDVGWNQPNGTNPTGGLAYGGIFATGATVGLYHPTFVTTPTDDWGIVAGSFKPYIGSSSYLQSTFHDSIPAPPALSFNNPVSAGSAIVIYIWSFHANGSVSSISDGVNTYVEIGTQYYPSGTLACQVFVAVNVAAGTPSIAFTVTGTWFEINMLEYSNISAVDQSGYSYGNPPPFSTTLSGSTTSNDEVILCGFAWDGGSSIDAGTDYTARINRTATADGWEVFSEDQDVTSEAMYTATGTVTAGGSAFYPWVGVMVTLVKGAVPTAAKPVFLLIR